MCYAEPGLNLHLPSISEFSIQFWVSWFLMHLLIQKFHLTEWPTSRWSLFQPIFQPLTQCSQVSPYFLCSELCSHFTGLCSFFCMLSSFFFLHSSHSPSFYEMCSDFLLCPSSSSFLSTHSCVYHCTSQPPWLSLRLFVIVFKLWLLIINKE